ncbi:MAG: GGDEF domain-containing protein, partial [Acidobacteria bacterium]|nr:GGDEF domain-containing protein [Acidobacteriota bacterium]
MNLDVTLNHNSHIDITSIEEETYRFILTLQSSTSISQVWELFLNVIDKAYPSMLEEAEIAYKSGTFNGALNTKIIPNCNNLNRKKILSREIDVNRYPFLEMAANNSDEMGYQCSGKEILIFTRSETYYIQVKMTFMTGAPFSLLLTLQNTRALEDCKDIGKEKLSVLCRIFLNQMALRLKIENLEFHSIKDDLTTAYNQKYLRNFIQTEIERCNRYPSFFSIVFFDLDNLKAINDKYGHLTGTEVLKEVAYILGCQIRKIELLSRFGGDD